MSVDTRDRLDTEVSAVVEQDQCSPKTTAIALIKRVFETYAHEKIGISFNAGKDSVVMLELIKEAMGLEVLGECVIFYLDTADEFPEMAQFRCDFERDRLPGVKVRHIPSENGLFDGLWTVKKTFDIDAVFMGTRHTDPSGKYQRDACEPTTNGWAPMMRVCPIFSWNVDDVWRYTKEQKLPFCSLYLRGYTSLGGSQVTSPNNALRNEDGTFAPAWSLKNNEEERSGRLSRSEPSTLAPSL